MADKGFMKMRILNYYCGKKDQDCRTMMCSRQQAACLTVEYVLAKNGTKFFHLFPNSKRILMFVKETTLFYHKFTNFKRVGRILLGGCLTAGAIWGSILEEMGTKVAQMKIF